MEKHTFDKQTKSLWNGIPKQPGFLPSAFSNGKILKPYEDEEWYPATIKKAWYGLHYISYDDYDDIWDEWVGCDRIRELK
ncbi:hypothetical protein [Tychonema sp. BBK16]|uniref:hypothetical protein n=1 Tax=Tychonema sp. BBK16 TaxID=2699888 RepID=UPI0038D40688